MHRNQSGVSLIELLITIIIISSVLVGIFQIYSTALRINFINEARSKAKFIAEQEMEHLRSLSFNASELDTFNSFLGKVNFKESGNYIIKSKITFLDPTSGQIADPYPVTEEDNTHLKEIIVSVVRKDGLGGQTDLLTYITP